MYEYDDVKQAYKAIIEVGKKQCGMFGAIAAQAQHKKNMSTLKGKAQELYVLLLNDVEINYQK